MGDRSFAWRVGIPIIVVGAWGGLIPFVGPLFGYSMGAGGAWTWTAARAELHVVPALAAIVGGVVLLTAAGSRSWRLGGGLLALVAGIWFLVGPSLSFVGTSSSPMAGHGMMMGSKMTGASLAMSPLQAIGYHYGPGAIIAVLAAVVVGYTVYVGTVRRQTGVMSPEAHQ
ncbi:MAG: hypothetical protein ACYCS9_04630 [Candidatus Dormibacteria bacterium]